MTVDAVPAPPPVQDAQPQHHPSPSTIQRYAVQDLVTALALKLSADTEPDLDALDTLARLLDAQTRSGELTLRLSKHLAEKRSAAVPK
ncbi:hypothetical protein AB0N87_28345 [Streptomyces sp. NPDC093228]|uniref:hypothetical protein n=1 Tax=Streptomyces sp. NPDC093228 TaxID=3155070 RepID=UPI00343DD39B